MKNLILLFFLGSNLLAGQSVNRAIFNQATFAKANGVLNYFYPIQYNLTPDINKLTLYGLYKVEKCPSDKILLSELEDIFKPLYPLVEFSNKPFLTPNNTNNDITKVKDSVALYWNHSGIRNGDYNSLYQNILYGSTNYAYTKGFGFGIPYQEGGVVWCYDGDLNKYSEYEIIVEAKFILSNGIASVGYNTSKMNDNQMPNLKRKYIDDLTWKKYSSTGKIDSVDKKIYFGIMLSGYSQVQVKNIELRVKTTSKDSTIVEFDFEKDINFQKIKDKNVHIVNDKFLSGKGNHAATIFTDSLQNIQCLSVHFDHSYRFKLNPKYYIPNSRIPDDYFTQKIGDSIYIRLPLVIKQHKNDFNQPMSQLKYYNNKLDSFSSNILSTEDKLVRKTAIVKTWNIFQHFYPYREYLDSGKWSNVLNTTLAASDLDQNASDHMKTLRQMLSYLNDGHVSVYKRDISATHALPIRWKIINDSLIITRVIDTTFHDLLGCQVTQIGEYNAIDYIQSIVPFTSASTISRKLLLSEYEALMGQHNQNVKIHYYNMDNKIDSVILPYSVPLSAYYSSTGMGTNSRSINDSIYYLNLGEMNHKKIKRNIKSITSHKVIICDLRQYPQFSHRFFGHFIPVKDTADSWMKIPQIHQPNYDKVSYDLQGFQIRKKKQFNNKIIALIDANTISYGESIAGILKHYSIATFIGENTAGTNGDMNIIDLPGGYLITFTGILVTLPDGTKLNGLGIEPNIFAKQKISDSISGIDTILQVAINYAMGVSH